MLNIKHNKNRQAMGLGSKLLTCVASCLLLCFSLFFSPVLSASEQSEKELKVKLAFIYNFAKFITWPDDVFKNEYDTINICLSEYESFEPALASYETKKIGHRNLVFRDIYTLSDLGVCNFMYLDSPPSDKIDIDFSRVGLVSVGNYDGVLDQGGVINFFTEDDKLRFSIDIKNATTVGVSFNSRLLRLAKVRQER